MVLNFGFVPAIAIETSYKGSKIKYYEALLVLHGTFAMTVYYTR